MLLCSILAQRSYISENQLEHDGWTDRQTDRRMDGMKKKNRIFMILKIGLSRIGKLEEMSKFRSTILDTVNIREVACDVCLKQARAGK